jgi:predicted outer membrane repeat protein
VKTSVCAVCLFLLLGVLADRASADEITLEIPVTPFSVTKDADGLAKFSGDAIQYLATGGEPAIPYQVVKALLPPDARLETLAVSIQSVQMQPVPGVWQVAPMKPAAAWKDGRLIVAWPKGKTIEEGKDQQIYATDALFPASLLQSPNCGQVRNWKLVDIPLALCRHNPVTHELFRLSQGQLVIRFDRTSAALSPLASGGGRSDRIGQERVKRIVVNYDQMAPAYLGRSPQISVTGAGHGYAIITTRAIQTGSQQLAEFVNSKVQRGFEVNVVTEEDWGGGTGNQAADHIRAWLQANYLGRDIEYVLLIGNPNPATGDVPMKMLWPRFNEVDYRESPSDYYYADLTGNWDLDGDGNYGEWNQDFGPGGVDRNWDVLVGRIPYYGNMDDLDHILAKIVAYENSDRADSAWRRNVLLPMKPSDSITPGYHLGEAIRQRIVASKRGWGYHRVYDPYTAADAALFTPPETLNCTVDNVTAAWNAADYGAVFWWTHGFEEEAVDVMDLPHAATLDDNHPAMIFQTSCNNSTPEDASNLAYSILKNGGIATVSATRASWYQPGQTIFAASATNAGLAYEYARRVVGQEMDSGHALFDAKQQVSPSDSPWWMNYTDFNLYGDPATLLVIADQRILDNGDPGTTAKGTWASRVTADSYGNNNLVSTQAGATYEFAAAVSGPQDASLWWSQDPGRCPDTEVQVYNGSTLLTELAVDQRKNGGRWNELGTFKFSGSARIVVRSSGTCSVSADAAMWAPRTVWYVAADAPATGDGSSWQKAFRSIQQAVDAAYSGDEIWVKAGTYALSQPIEMGKINLGLYGGFAGTETARNQRDSKAHPTIVDGTNTVRCFHLISETTLDGLTIENGHTADYGGGIWVDAASTIANCTFTKNYGGQLGGAVYIAAGGSLSVSRCTFSDNESGNMGGAVYGGAENFTISDSLFQGNHAKWYGGAIYTDSSSSPSIADTVFAQNNANRGGGIYCRPNSFTRIVNCTFSKNSAVDRGGALCCQDAAPAVTNSIFWQDSAPTNPEIDRPSDAALAVSFSDIDQDGYAGSKGNIRQDPAFVAIAQLDLHLQAISPCIDTGNTMAAVNLSYELDDLRRPVDGNEDNQSVIDMGALEYIPDGDGLPDDWEMEYFASLGQSAAGDPDADGLNNLEEFNHDTDPSNPDSDGDSLPDGWEVTYHLDPMDHAGDNGKDGDPDHDGWTNYEEFVKGSDPSVARSGASISPETVDFGSVAVGQKATVSLTITNIQIGDLKIDTMTIEGPNGSEFEIQNDGWPGKVLAHSETGSLSVVFAPGSQGDKTATLSISSNDPDSPLSVPLRGTASAGSTSSPGKADGGGGGGGGGCFIGASGLWGVAH